MPEGISIDLGQATSLVVTPQNLSANSIVVTKPTLGPNVNSGRGQLIRRAPEGTFLTEVAMNDPSDYNRIVYNNLIETPGDGRRPPQTHTNAKKVFPPAQDLGSYMSTMTKKMFGREPSGYDQRNIVHQPIVVHGMRDSQFNLGNRKVPPPIKKDAFYPLKKLNKRKQIEELAAELTKKDNFQHDFSKHSISDDNVSVASSRKSARSVPRSLPPLSTRSQEISNAVTESIGIIEKDNSPTQQDVLDVKSVLSTSSRRSRRSQKSKDTSILSYSIGSDAESDRIRQLEQTLKKEEESRVGVLKVLEDIQKKQDYLLSKLSEKERQQFEEMYGYSTSDVQDMLERQSVTSGLSAKDVKTLTENEHLPKIDAPSVAGSAKTTTHSAAPSHQSRRSNNTTSSYPVSTKTTVSQLETTKKMIQDMFKTIVRTDSVVTLEQSDQLAKLLERYPNILSEQDKELFYQKHNDPRFNGATCRSLRTRDHSNSVVFH